MILDMIRRWFGAGGAGGSEGPGGSGGGETGPQEDSDMLTCHEALEWMFEFMDGELPDADAAKVDQHFKMCQACYPHLKLEESFRCRLQAAVGGSGVPDDVRSRVMDLLAQEEAGGS